MIFILSFLIFGILVNGIKTKYTGCGYKGVYQRWNILDLPKEQSKAYFEVLSQLNFQQAPEQKLGMTKLDVISSKLANSSDARDYDLFPAWHRYFLYILELDLRKNNSKIPFIPYWDWTAEENLEFDKGILSKSLFGQSDSESKCVNSGPLVYIKVPETYGEFSITKHCLKRNIFQPQGSLPNKADVQELLSSESLGQFGYRLTSIIRKLGFLFTKDHNEFTFYQDPLFFSVMSFNNKLLDQWLSKNQNINISKSDTVLQPWGITMEKALYHSRAICRSYL